MAYEHLSAKTWRCVTEWMCYVQFGVQSTAKSPSPSFICILWLPRTLWGNPGDLRSLGASIMAAIFCCFCCEQYINPRLDLSL